MLIRKIFEAVWIDYELLSAKKRKVARFLADNFFDGLKMDSK